jgi:hypothetical protein
MGQSAEVVVLIELEEFVPQNLLGVESREGDIELWPERRRYRIGQESEGRAERLAGAAAASRQDALGFAARECLLRAEAEFI